MRRIAGLILMISLAILTGGCGRSDLPELGSVSGVLTCNNQPLANAIINFTPDGPGRPSTAETDEEGRYSLLYLEDVEGAIVGKHVVTVELVVTEEMDELPDSPADLAPGQQMAPRLPAIASNGSITKEVRAGDNEIDIAL